MELCHYSSSQGNQESLADEVGSKTSSVSYTNTVTISGSGRLGMQTTTNAGNYSYGGRGSSYNTTTLTLATLSGHDLGSLSPEVGTVPCAAHDVAGRHGLASAGAGRPGHAGAAGAVGHVAVGPAGLAGVVVAGADELAQAAVQVANLLGNKPSVSLSAPMTLMPAHGPGGEPGAREHVQRGGRRAAEPGHEGGLWLDRSVGSAVHVGVVGLAGSDAAVGVVPGERSL